MYKSMSFTEIINLINEVSSIADLIAISLHEFNLSTDEIYAIGSDLKSMNEIGECLTTIATTRKIKGI